MTVLILALAAWICCGLYAVTRATCGITLDVVETVGTNAEQISSARNSVTFDGQTEESALTSATTPNVTVHAVGIKTMTSGAVTLDLRTLTGLNGVAVDLNGLKPRMIVFENPSTNANPVTIVFGSATPYTGLGAAFNLTLQVGQKVALLLGTAGTAVSGSVKFLDITGTGSQVLNYEIVAGT